MKYLLVFLFFTAKLCCQPSEFKNYNFQKADSIARSYPAESIENLPALVYGLTHLLDTDFEKFRAIYYWVATNIANDYEAYRNTISKRKKLNKNSTKLAAWNTAQLPKVFKRLRKKRKAACTGYAYLIEQMAHLAGMDCHIVNGYAKTATSEVIANNPNHSWNAIELNGNWFLCDATWSAGLVNFDEGVPNFKFEYSNAYFLASPKLFAKNHYPTEEKWLLLDEAYTFEEFDKGALVYKAAFEEKVTPLEPKNMFIQTVLDATLQFKFELSENTNLDEIGLQVIKNDNIEYLKPTITVVDSSYSLTYSFKKRGLFDVHLTKNKKPLATWVVTVKKASP